MFAKAVATATAAAMRARGMRPETVAIGPWNLRVWRGGKPGGEPWLLLHGMGATSATYLPLLGALKDDCEVVIPELSANGGTSGPRAAIGVADGVEVVAQLLKRYFEGRSTTVAGVSLGGWIALKLAIAHPGLASRLFLVVPGGYKHQDWRRIESMVHVQTLADIGAMWKALFVKPPWFLRLGRYGLYLLYSTPTVSDVLATVREADAFDDADLARVAIPVGIVWGAGDSLFRVEAGEAMLRTLPRATLTVIPGAGHGVQWEKPRDFLGAVERFRAELPLPAPAAAAQDRAERSAV
ncbi:MAG TPA: alpha/beta hydrolase [Thermoanaerobaculia bacterium]|nr:alpha/beta hydrolase [Thermoanaerobaculia bacterium]